jgi:hypothetical protein
MNLNGYTIECSGRADKIKFFLTFNLYKKAESLLVPPFIDIYIYIIITKSWVAIIVHSFSESELQQRFPLDL